MHVSQTLELALSLLDQDPNSRMYMCCHLDWMSAHARKHITLDESEAAQEVIRNAIGNNVTLAGYLRETGSMPQGVSVQSPEYVHYQLTFYRNLIAKLRAADPMFLIIEAAYHCCHSEGEIHTAIKAAGLPETSDETVMNLLGEYAASIKE
jgi:hypothetical protein